MAFGGAATTVTPGDSNASAKYAYARITGLTLAARAGAPAAAAADTGELTTGTPGANQTQAPAQFGRGAGNWVDDDANLVEVDVNDTSSAAQGAAGETPIVYVSSISVVDGNLVIQLHNRGAQASGALDIRLRMMD